MRFAYTFLSVVFINQTNKKTKTSPNEFCVVVCAYAFPYNHFSNADIAYVFLSRCVMRNVTEDRLVSNVLGHGRFLYSHSFVICSLEMDLTLSPVIHVLGRNRSFNTKKMFEI